MQKWSQCQGDRQKYSGKNAEMRLDTVNPMLYVKKNFLSQAMGWSLEYFCFNGVVIE